VFRMGIVRTFLVALSTTMAVGIGAPAFAQGSAACDLDAVAANKEELARLTALRRLDHGAVSHDVFVAASERYVQSAEACFTQLY
jgi:hypothetical protein